VAAEADRVAELAAQAGTDMRPLPPLGEADLRTLKTLLDAFSGQAVRYVRRRVLPDGLNITRWAKP
jgi:hypothetical protein